MKLDSKYFDRIRVRPEQDRTQEPRSPLCQKPGCTAPGVHKAPQGRGREGKFFLFCIDHVREYNAKYDYFNGMSDDQVAAYQKSAVTGHRPTWQVGANAWAHGGVEPGTASEPRGFSPRTARDDPFGFFEAQATGAESKPQPPKPAVGKATRKALAALNLDGLPSKEDIKTRFKELVKRHHPDANGGDRSSEDRLREIIQAYNFLRQAGLC
jgi:curved DNA-binding protein CbpA